MHFLEGGGSCKTDIETGNVLRGIVTAVTYGVNCNGYSFGKSNIQVH